MHPLSPAVESAFQGMHVSFMKFQNDLFRSVSQQAPDELHQQVLSIVLVISVDTTLQNLDKARVITTKSSSMAASIK
jgi:hypothetical protein